MTLTVQQCAKELGVASHSIRKWIWDGKLHAQKVPKGREQWTYIIRAEDWMAFVKQWATKLQAPDELDSTPPSKKSHAYFVVADPDDRQIERAALMRKALKGCKASREALRGDPYRLTYWMAVDGER